MDEILSNYINDQVLIIPQNIHEEISFNGVKFNQREEYFTIIDYINRFLDGNPINRYLILPGIRDIGKSTVLFQVYDYLLTQKNIAQKNMLFLSCDKLKKIFNASIYDVVTAYLKLFHNSIPETLSEPVFLFIDEAQYDPEWASTGKILFDSSKKIFMIFSGSSALNLSYNADSARRLLRIPAPPLNYSEHLKLKYGHFDSEISDFVEKIVFEGDVTDSEELEWKIRNMYADFKNFNVNEFDDFIQFGGFPSSFNQKPHEITKKISDSVDKVITLDMKMIDGFNDDTIDLAFQVLNFFVLQDPGEVSKESLANIYNSNKTTINKILNTLEKTLLLFRIDPFTSSPKRTTKPSKYYFSTSSLKHNLALNMGHASKANTNAYMGKLFEHFVASSFFNLNYKMDIPYKIYYDAGSKGKKNVDFIIQRGMENPIPVEVSWGKKDKSQIKKAISKYDAPYGIIISNTTANILKKDNIIYLPPKIFALM